MRALERWPWPRRWGQDFCTRLLGGQQEAQARSKVPSSGGARRLVSVGAPLLPVTTVTPNARSVSQSIRRVIVQRCASAFKNLPDSYIAAEHIADAHEIITMHHSLVSAVPSWSELESRATGVAQHLRSRQLAFSNEQPPPSLFEHLVTWRRVPLPYIGM
jgi:hypothetical protein